MASRVPSSVILALLLAPAVAAADEATPASAHPEPVEGRVVVLDVQIDRAPGGGVAEIRDLAAAWIKNHTTLSFVSDAEMHAALAARERDDLKSRASGINRMVTGAVVGWAGGGALAATGVGLLVVF